MRELHTSRVREKGERESYTLSDRAVIRERGPRQ